MTWRRVLTWIAEYVVAPALAEAIPAVVGRDRALRLLCPSCGRPGGGS